MHRQKQSLMDTPHQKPGVSLTHFAKLYPTAFKSYFSCFSPKQTKLNSTLQKMQYTKVTYLSDWVSGSHSVMSDSLWPHGLYSPWDSPGQNTGVGSLCLLQGIFPTQRSNSGLPHCRQILYQLGHNRRPLSERGKAIPITITKRFEGNLIVFYSF